MSREQYGLPAANDTETLHHTTLLGKAINGLDKLCVWFTTVLDL